MYLLHAPRGSGGAGMLFLKRHKHQTFGDMLHHRCPAVPPGQQRLCVAIDY